METDPYGYDDRETEEGVDLLEQVVEVSLLVVDALDGIVSLSHRYVFLLDRSTEAFHNLPCAFIFVSLFPYQLHLLVGSPHPLQIDVELSAFDALRTALVPIHDTALRNRSISFRLSHLISTQARS